MFLSFIIVLLVVHSLALNSQASIVYVYAQIGFDPIHVGDDFLVDGTLSVIFEDAPVNTLTTIFDGFNRREVHSAFLVSFTC